MIFQEKPKQIEALKFSGGVDSAREVMEWLYARGGSGRYVFQILNDGEEVLAEHIEVSSTLRSGRFLLSPNSWVMLVPPGGFRRLNEKWLFETYDLVEN